MKNLFAFLCIVVDRLLVYFKINQLYSNKPKFIKLFYRNESRELLGVNSFLGTSSWYFWRVWILFVLTILSLGFANDGLKFLREEMKDPFVYYVTANLQGPFLNNEANYKPTILDKYIMFADSANKYKYDTIYKFYDETGIVFQKTNGAEAVCFGRSVPAEDSLVNAIFKVSKKSLGHGFNIPNNWFIESEDNYSIIVTYNLLENVLDHDIINDPPFLKLYGYYLPIAGVVEQLPNKGDFLATDKFFEYYRTPNIFKDAFRINDIDTAISNKLFFIVDIKPEIEHEIIGNSKSSFACNRKNKSNVVTDIKKDNINYKDTVQKFVNLAIKELFESDNNLKNHIRDRNCIVNAYSLAYKETFHVQITLNDISNQNIDEIFRYISTSDHITNLLKRHSKSSSNIIPFYQAAPELSGVDKYASNPMRISINFNDLEHVSQFSRNFSKTTFIQLDLDKIKSLENYSFITLLTIVLAIVLIIFSFISINIYIYNIVSNHLNKIKMNLGTFKAFGIEVKSIYYIMLFLFVFLTEGFAIIFCVIIGRSHLVYKLLTIGNSNINSEFNYFYIGGWGSSYNDWGPPIVIILMFVVSFSTSLFTINSILKESPGNLIHGRE